MARELNIEKAYNDTVERRPAANINKKLAVLWINEVQVLNQIFVHRNRNILVSAKTL